MTEAILSPRPLPRFTDDDRKRIATGWRASGLSQEAYAAKNHIRPRTLRLWLREHAPALSSPNDVLAVQRQALDALRRAVALLEEGLVMPFGATPNPMTSNESPVTHPANGGERFSFD